MKTLSEKQRQARLARAAIASAVLAAFAGSEAIASGMPSSYVYSGTAYTLHNQDTLRKTGYYWDDARGNVIAVTFTDETWNPDTASVKALSTDSGFNYVSGSKNAAVTGGSHGASTGSHSSVTGGKYNNASGDLASVSGGSSNTASGNYASVTGGYSSTARGKYSSVSGGRSNAASGNYSAVSGGYSNTASGESSLAAGGSTNEASGKYASAFGGQGSAVLGESSTGVAGGSTGADASYALAAGHQSVAAAEKSAAIGWQATASETGTVSFGHDAGDVSGYALGSDGTWTATTYKDSAYSRLVKVGYGTDGHDAATVAQLPEATLAENESNLTLVKTTDSATGKNSYALGLSSSLTGLASVAVGSLADKAGFTVSGTSLAASYGTSGLSLSQNGFAAKTSGAVLAVTASGAQMNTLTSGFFATSGQAKITGGGSSLTVTGSGVSVGGAKITDVGAGTLSTSSTEAVNGSQLFAVKHSLDTLAGKKITVKGNSGSETTALGDTLSIAGDGTNVKTQVSAGKVEVTLGDELQIATSVAVGSQAGKAGFKASSSGLAADYGTSGLSLSQNGFAAKTSAALLAVTASGAQMNAADSGFAATSGQAKITGGGSSVTVTDGGVSVGSAKITDVGAGTLSASSTEAVNGSQLWSVSQSLTELSGKKITFKGNAGSAAAALGGAFSILGDGTNIETEVTENQVLLKLRDELAVATSVTVGGSSVISGDGFFAGGGSGSSLTQSALRVAGSTYITGNGIDANKQKITHVADGTVAQGSTDAVNGGQLYAVEKKVTDLTDASLAFRADDGSEVKKKLGDTVTIAGDEKGNITTTVAEDGKIQVKLSDSLDIAESVKVGGEDGVLLTKDGVSYGGKTYIGKDGLNANNEKISNVADGSVTEGSKDAVNGGQLWETNQKIDKVAETAGNAVTWDKETGQFTDGKTGNVIEKVKIAGTTISSSGIDNGGQKITNIADGTAAGDAVNYGQLQDAVRNSVTAVEGDGKYIETSFTQTDAGKTYTVSFTESSKKAIENANAYLTSDGITAGGKKVTNVAAGELSATSADAVNGSQLYATNQQVEANAGSITKLWKKTGDLNKKINRAGANAAALAALHPLDYDEDHKVSASAGIGQYHGTGALAVGVFIRPTENLMLNLGGAFASDDKMFSAGLSYRFGDNSSEKFISKADMATRVSALTAENRDLTAQLTSTSAKLEAASGRLEATNAELKAANAKIEALAAEIEAIKAALRK